MTSDIIEEAFARLREKQTIMLQRQDWNLIVRTLREKADRLRKPGNKSYSTLEMHKRQAEELEATADRIELLQDVYDSTTGPLTKA